MKRLITVLLLCQAGSGGKHSLMFYLMLCSGVPDVPDFLIVADLDEVPMAYYDNSMSAPEGRHEWVSKLMEEDPHHWEQISLDSKRYQQLLQGETESFKLSSSQSPGAHVIQQVMGCEWDDEAESVDGCKKYGYNGKDFITFDLQSNKWIAANPQAEITKEQWDREETNNKFWKNFLTNRCPLWMKKYLKYASTFLQKRERPSNMTIPIIAAVVGCALVLIISTTGFIVYRRRKARCPPSAPESSSELSDPLKSET